MPGDRSIAQNAWHTFHGRPNGLRQRQGFCFTPWSRAWAMPFASMISRLPSAIAEGSAWSPNRLLPMIQSKILLKETPLVVEQEIIERIEDRAIEPQVVVTLVTQNTSLITVLGEVNNSTTASPTSRVPAQPAGEHLLDVISRAGGKSSCEL
jgi:hypothetical protein